MIEICSLKFVVVQSFTVNTVKPTRDVQLNHRALKLWEIVPLAVAKSSTQSW